MTQYLSKFSFRIKRREGTIFIALPEGTGEPIRGGCQCRYCNTHPTKTPRWDTIALAAVKSRVDRNDTTWMVHYPELNEGSVP